MIIICLKLEELLGRMNEKEAGGLGFLIFIGFIALIIFIIKLELAVIQFERFMFWLDLILIPLGLISFVVFLIIAYKDEWDCIPLIVAGVSFIVILFAVFTISTFYNDGYSNQAIQREAELRNELQQYQAIMDLITMKTAYDIQTQVLQETINSMCLQNVTFPCEQMKQNLQVYQDIAGMKEQADSIAEFIGNSRIQKLKNSKSSIDLDIEGL